MEKKTTRPIGVNALTLSSLRLLTDRATVILFATALQQAMVDRLRRHKPVGVDDMTVDGPVPAASLLPKVAARITELEAQAAEVTA